MDLIAKIVLEKRLERDIKLPVLHMPQMVALALGCTPEEIGLKYNVVKATTLLED